ncbi:hypothetical protein NPIL_550291 [Nephila pilipes]|uniref:Uncharacterized protein n=1 Tax=Nephila pilipes TaxID=299642 RepID=A0A8X6QQI3_NEPPI|nr:hypothetical protein NPIL_550291 [Nephila pilipes]
MRASLGEQPLQSCIETFHFRGKGEGRGSQRIVEGQNEHYRVNSRIRGQSKDNVQRSEKRRRKIEPLFLIWRLKAPKIDKSHACPPPLHCT